MSYNNPIVFTTCPIVFHDVDKKYPIFATDWWYSLINLFGNLTRISPVYQRWHLVERVVTRS